LKRTWAGPPAMGLCRSLNVLLGLSVAGKVGGVGVLLAVIVGLYVTGVTWFARTEAKVSSRNALSGAAAVLAAALVAAVPVPAAVDAGVSSPLYVYLLVAFGFAVGLPVWQAIESPTPGHVQAAVKRSLMGLIVLDAILASGLAGSVG